MGFYNHPDKPKVLRTQLDEETHRKFKHLSIEQKTTMAEYIEALIKKEVKRVYKKDTALNDSLLK
jgi:hypothetical protein